VYSRPFLDLDLESARPEVDPQGLLGDVKGKDVLCLAGGGGQQSAAFALLGAHVTVFDLSETQLARDRETAAHYGLEITTVQGDMRDLSCFEDDAFDVVWHAYSINFVPDALPVLREVARVLRTDGLYRVQFHNPFVTGIDETDWTGTAYPLKQPYVDGGELTFSDPHWDVYAEDGSCTRVVGPREFRHALSTMVNGLVDLGFVILGLREELSADPSAEPGTWEHFKSIAPPWLTIWAAYRPYVFR
jgi:SAM-dependent methyltransferase